MVRQPNGRVEAGCHRLRSSADPVDPRQVTLIGRMLCCLIPTLALACTTTRELEPVNVDTAVVQRLDPERAWRVIEGGTLRGYVVRFVDRKVATRCSYSVRNELQQELGTIDELGRAWRFVPHQREASFVCTSTLTRGVSELLRTGPATKLEEVELDLLRTPSDAR